MDTTRYLLRDAIDLAINDPSYWRTVRATALVRMHDVGGHSSWRARARRDYVRAELELKRLVRGRIEGQP